MVVDQTKNFNVWIETNKQQFGREGDYNFITPSVVFYIFRFGLIG